MRIYNNIPALQTLNSLTRVTGALQKSIQNLSTGLRVNNAADDAAGLAISEKMRAQVRGLDQAARNSQDAISLIQTAEGALNEAHSNLQRMRELAVQAANDTITQNDRDYIQLEIDQLKEEINRISTTTQFNKMRILDGMASAVWSSDNLSTEAAIRGNVTMTGENGEEISAAGNYRIVISATPGEAEVQKGSVLNVGSKEISDVKREPVYVVFSLDNTGSINSQKNILKANIEQFINTIKDSGVSNVNIGISAYAYDGVRNYQAHDFGGTLWSSDVSAINAALDSYDFRAPYGEIATLAVVDSVNTYFSSGIDNSNSYLVVVTDSHDNSIFEYGPYARRGSSEWAADAAKAIADSGVCLSAIRTGDSLNETYLDPIISTGPGMTFQYGTGWGTDLSDGLGELIGDRADVEFDYVNVDKTLDSMVEFKPDGVSIFNDPQNLTIYQGDGKSVGVTLYGSDTMYTAAKKINDAIAFGLGQSVYVDDADRFCAISDGTEGTSESIFKSDEVLGTVEFMRDSEGKLIYDQDGYQILLPSGINSKFVYKRDREGNLILDEFGNPIITSDPPAFTDQKFKVSYQRDENGDLVLDAGGSPMFEDLTLLGEKYYATMLVRSVIPGAEGELKFSGDEELLKALGLATIRESRESEFHVSVYDAHSGETLKSLEKISGNMLYGAVTDNVDVSFDPLANTKVTWNEKMKQFELTGEDGVYTTFVHIAGRSMTFQIGANEAEDMTIGIGNMSSRALGVHKVLVVDRESASRAITVIDGAIDRVSKQRAGLGAYQNRLEHTINNLTVASENLTASESRIRDLDMAKEMMNFTKLSILVQSSQAMLGQANQLPDGVLTLIR